MLASLSTGFEIQGSSLLGRESPSWKVLRDPEHTRIYTRAYTPSHNRSPSLPQVTQCTALAYRCATERCDRNAAGHAPVEDRERSSLEKLWSYYTGWTIAPATISKMRSEERR